MLLLTSEDKCCELGLEPMARYVCAAVSGGDPVLVLTGCIPATRLALDKAGLRLGDIDHFEINEPFAAVPMVWIQDLEPSRPERVNAWGGAIANGNPLGTSGIKLACTPISGLAREGGRYGLIAACAGMGMGVATILERV